MRPKNGAAIGSPMPASCYDRRDGGDRSRCLKFLLKQVFIVVPISLLITLFLTFQEKEIKEEFMNKEPKMTIVERTVEERRVEVNIDDKFEIDHDQLAFETNKEGKFIS